MRKLFATIFFCQIVLLCLGQTNRTDLQEIVIPMDVTSTRPIVELTINGKGPYNFIFDTGSSANVIDAGLHRELGLKVVGKDPLSTPGSENRLVSQRVAAPKVSFPGTKIFKDVEMSVVALRAMLPVDGILSGVFFEDYLLTIDYQGSKLILTNGELDKSNSNVTSFIQKPRVLNLNLEVDGNMIEAHLDSGSPGGISLPYDMKEELTFKEAPKESQPVRTPVATFRRWEAELVGKIKMGNVLYENPQIALVEFEFANLGYQVIKDLRITIDRENNLIRFEKTAEARIVENEHLGSTNEFTGWYGGKVRQIIIENGEMYLRRGDVKLRLDVLDGNLYQMTYSVPVRNELPNVRFEKNEKGQINGFTFIYKDGKEEFVKKD